MKASSCAFVTHYPMPDYRAFSGISYFMARYLELAHVQVHYVHATPPAPPWPFRIRRKIYKKLLGRGMREDRDLNLARATAAVLDDKLSQIDFDFILAPGSLAVAYLKNPRPKFFWTDATFAGYINFSQDFRDMSSETILRGNQLEQQSLDNSALAFYSSEWAAQSAQDNYKVDRKKLKIVPFGANFELIPSTSVVEKAISQRNFSECRLLFCGVEWERKGGPLTLQVLRSLRERGQKVRLQIIGCTPDIPADLREAVVIHGYISKKTHEGQAKMAALFQEAHFLILPAIHEACAIAFSEASAYGLPILASQVGGCATVVRDNRNGRLFPVGVDPKIVADQIMTIISDQETYRDWARGSRREFEERLNWPSAIATVLSEIEKQL